MSEKGIETNNVAKYDFPDDFLSFAVKVISSVCPLTKSLEALRLLLTGNALGMEAVRSSVEEVRQELDDYWQNQLEPALRAGGIDKFLDEYKKEDIIVREKEILWKALSERFSLDAHRWKVFEKDSKEAT